MPDNGTIVNPRFLTFTRDQVQAILQRVAILDEEVIEGSNRPVTGGAVYAMFDTPREVKIVTQTSTGSASSPVAINPNCLNRWTSSVGSLFVSLRTGNAAIANEYMLEFTVTGNSFSLSLPGNIRWVDGDEPEWENGNTYQVSIENGLAIAAGWPAS